MVVGFAGFLLSSEVLRVAFEYSSHWCERLRIGVEEADEPA